MIFRQAQKEDAAEILHLYRSVTGLPFCTWNESYPGMLEIEWDTAAGTLYLMEENNRIIGAISIVPENENDDMPEWSVRVHAREIARVAVDPVYQGKHIAGEMLTQVLTLLQEGGCAAVHLLAAQKNPPAQALYRRAGFSAVGFCHLYDTDFILFEKNF